MSRAVELCRCRKTIHGPLMISVVCDQRGVVGEKEPRLNNWAPAAHFQGAELWKSEAAPFWDTAA